MHLLYVVMGTVKRTVVQSIRTRLLYSSTAPAVYYDLRSSTVPMVNG